MGLSMATAERWVTRWERQQEHYAVDREERFSVIGDVVQHVTRDQDRPLIVDLGCGPGSLAARLAARLATARIIAADIDPLLLELGRTHHPDAARYVEVMIGRPGWIEALGLDRQLDAAVSTTALHYPSSGALQRIYQDLASVLRPGGVLVNGDHLVPEEPAIAALTGVVGRGRAHRVGAGEAEDWAAWWAAARQDAELADLFDARTRRPDPADAEGDGNGLTLHQHIRLLREAGFRHAGPVWRCGDSCVLVAIR